jgi:rubredoxin
MLLDAACLFNVSSRHADSASATFSRRLGLCYNRKAVKDTGKQELAPAAARGVVVENASQPLEPASGATSHLQEDASRYCPVCSQRLESRRCKLVCKVCGYYMSCADYY